MCASSSRVRSPCGRRGPAPESSFRELDAEPCGELLDRLLEGEVFNALEEVDDVATDLASEAVVEPLRGGDVEAGAALLMERAQAL